MALTRSALREKGITEKEILDYIMEEHGNTIEVTKDKLKEAHDSSIDKMQKKIDALQEQVNNIPEQSNDNEDLQNKLDELQKKYETDIAAKDTEFSTYKSKIEEEKIESKKREALRSQLSSDGANQKLIGLLEKEFDISTIELNGDKIKDWETIAKPIKDNYSDVFGKVEIEGVESINPPGGNNLNEKDLFIEGFEDKK